MALIQEVKSICTRLAGKGWKTLLLKHGLDITASNLATELGKTLTVDRNVPGFADFAANGNKGIEPGSPARSLLYHALASPLVREVGGQRLGAFPTLKEIETVENYVFAARKISLTKLQQLAASGQLAVVVFALEYRPAKDTAHGQHADLAFSRTGVARVGTTKAKYLPEVRGFLPFADGDPHALRVLPARYAAFLAVKRKGNEAAAVPMDFAQGDGQRNFWLPIHKLFSGTECLTGSTLQVSFATRHVNEKLGRVRQFVDPLPPAQRQQPPFLFDAGIAELSTDAKACAGLVVPIPHPSLVAEAKLPNGRPATFRVPPNQSFANSSTLIIDSAANGARHAPEYVHVRTRIENGTATDLNTLPNVTGLVAQGGYQALHYIDFTADGWVRATCQGLPPAISNLPAYSLVAAPDFFPACGQRELLDWSESLGALADEVWSTPPEYLSEQRLAANVQLPGSPFDISDGTMTAVVPLLNSPPRASASASSSDVLRHSCLPDDAAGFFAPGWDTSWDVSAAKKPHLAAYGLGSPFPEDAKLCAALSTFWPAAAPDATRGLEPFLTSSTVSPLTDDEIGSTGNLPWDGIAGPRVVTENGLEFAVYADFNYADYTLNALKNKFSIALTGPISADEYQDRVLGMALVYRAMSRQFQETANQARNNWLLLSFRPAAPGDAERLGAEQEAQTTLTGRVFRFEMIRNGTGEHRPDKTWRVRVTQRTRLLAAPSLKTVLIRAPGGAWKKAPLGPV